MLKKGLIQIYTGDGKGKTTCAFGQALRALGRGLKVCIFQFLKDKDLSSGEVIAAKEFKENLKIIRGCQIHPYFDSGKHSNDLKEEVERMLLEIKRTLQDGKYDIVILDEINNCIDLGVVKKEEILDIMDIKPQNVELILTGRDAPYEIIDRADLVTNMSLVKHPFYTGVGARKGIEY